MGRGEEILLRVFASGDLRWVESRRPNGTADWVVWARREYLGALQR